MEEDLDEDDKKPATHVGYVAMSRAKTHAPDVKEDFENITLLHPLKPEDFEIPETRRQRILGEYERLRNMDGLPQPAMLISMDDSDMVEEMP